MAKKSKNREVLTGAPQETVNPAQQETAARSVRKSAAKKDIGTAVREWFVRNRVYFLAFFIPVVVMYIAYAIFGLYPFGEQSVLALDFNAQYVYYFEALRDAFWGDGSVFYSWGRNLSGGMMGIIGYYLASPFTLIVMLLPRKMILTSLLIMILCKIGSAGVTFNLYLQKSKGLPPLHATVFSTLYALMAYMVIQTVDPMWLDGLVLLPLVALGIERLVESDRKLNYIIPLALIFVANFYIGYMIGIFAVVYFVYYLFFASDRIHGKLRSTRDRKAQSDVPDYAYVCCNFGICSIVAVMLSAFMILPVYNALQLGKFDFTDPDYSFQVQFEPVTILAQLLTAQYDSVNVQGSPEIYCGILTVTLLPLFFLNKKISMRRKFGYGFLLMVMFFSMYIKPVDMWWHGGQVPNWLPFRYSFIVSFILLSIAATTWKHLDGVELKHLGGTFFGIMAVILYIHGVGYEHLDVMGSIWLSIGLTGAYLLVIYAQKLRTTKLLVPVVLLFVISGELVFNTVETLRDLDEEVVYSSKASYEGVVENGRKAVEKMEALDSGLYRSEKTYTRCINDNMAFGLKGLTHSSSVMNAKTLTFIETLGYSSRSYYTRYDGTTELADSLLGIKYVLDRDGRATPQAGNDVEDINNRRRTLLHADYPKVGEHTYTDKNSDGTDQPPTTIGIYENPNALSIGYMVSDDLLRIDHLGNDNPFNSQNILFSTMLGKTSFDENGGIADFSEYYTRIPVGDPVLGAVTVSDYNGQTCYTKMDSGDPTIDYRFTVESDEEVMFFLKTENEQAVNLWLGVYDDSIGDYKFGSAGFGQYFETHNYTILSLGHFTPGTQVALRLTVLDKDNATIIKEPMFYYFNRDAYQADIEQLKAQQLNVEKFDATHINGTVTAGEDQVLFTSIPYEPGWTIKVDGKKICTTGSADTDVTKTIDDSGKTQKTEKIRHEIIKAMIYVPLEAGTHTISMSYTPPGFVSGMFMLLLGVGMCVVFYLYDKKHPTHMYALPREEQTGGNAENGTAQENQLNEAVQQAQVRIGTLEAAVAQANSRADALEALLRQAQNAAEEDEDQPSGPIPEGEQLEDAQLPGEFPNRK